MEPKNLKRKIKGAKYLAVLQLLLLKCTKERKKKFTKEKIDDERLHTNNNTSLVYQLQTKPKIIACS